MGLQCYLAILHSSLRWCPQQLFEILFFTFQSFNAQRRQLSKQNKTISKKYNASKLLTLIVYIKRAQPHTSGNWCGSTNRETYSSKITGLQRKNNFQLKGSKSLIKESQIIIRLWQESLTPAEKTIAYLLGRYILSVVFTCTCSVWGYLRIVKSKRETLSSWAVHSASWQLYPLI